MVYDDSAFGGLRPSCQGAAYPIPDREGMRARKRSDGLRRMRWLRPGCRCASPPEPTPCGAPSPCYTPRRLDAGRGCPHHVRGSGRGEVRAHLALIVPKACRTKLCTLSGASTHSSTVGTSRLRSRSSTSPWSCRKADRCDRRSAVRSATDYAWFRSRWRKDDGSAWQL